MTDLDFACFGSKLLREVLLKLLNKSSIRFTVVCKSWHSLITNFYFISAHLTQTLHFNTFIVRRYIRTRKIEHYLLFQESKNRPFSLDFTSEHNFLFKCQHDISKLLAIAMTSHVCLMICLVNCEVLFYGTLQFISYKYT